MKTMDVTLRQVGRSLYFLVPPEYKHEHGLKAGDRFYWSSDGDRVELRRMTPAILAQIDKLVDASSLPRAKAKRRRTG
jgi:hypothetical protein